MSDRAFADAIGGVDVDVDEDVDVDVDLDLDLGLDGGSSV
jgi:hypothetical protein